MQPIVEPTPNPVASPVVGSGSMPHLTSSTSNSDIQKHILSETETSPKHEHARFVRTTIIATAFIVFLGLLSMFLVYRTQLNRLAEKNAGKNSTVVAFASDEAELASTDTSGAGENPLAKQSSPSAAVSPGASTSSDPSNTYPECLPEQGNYSYSNSFSLTPTPFAEQLLKRCPIYIFKGENIDFAQYNEWPDKITLGFNERTIYMYRTKPSFKKADYQDVYKQRTELAGAYFIGKTTTVSIDGTSQQAEVIYAPDCIPTFSFNPANPNTAAPLNCLDSFYGLVQVDGLWIEATLTGYSPDDSSTGVKAELVRVR